MRSPSSRVKSPSPRQRARDIHVERVRVRWRRGSAGSVPRSGIAVGRSPPATGRGWDSVSRGRDSYRPGIGHGRVQVDRQCARGHDHAVAPRAAAGSRPVRPVAQKRWRSTVRESSMPSITTMLRCEARAVRPPASRIASESAGDRRRLDRAGALHFAADVDQDVAQPDEPQVDVETPRTALELLRRTGRAPRPACCPRRAASRDPASRRCPRDRLRAGGSWSRGRARRA